MEFEMETNFFDFLFSEGVTLEVELLQRPGNAKAERRGELNWRFLL